MTVCNYCHSDKETISNGYVVCRSCGTTKDREFVDHLPIKTIGNNEVYSHNSMGKTVDFVGNLGSRIGYSSGILRGARGRKLKNKTVYKYKRLNKYYNERSRIEGNATHLRTMIAFNRVCSKMEIPKSLKHRALFLYWQNVKKDIKITNHVLLIALCTLQSVREAGEKAPIRFSEIIKAFADNGHRVTNKNILRLARELGVELNKTRRVAEDYVERIASDIRWDETVQQRVSSRKFSLDEYELLLVQITRKFLSLLSRKDRGGVQPFPFAVSAIYLADRALGRAIGRKPVLTQNILANAADSAEFTIRDHVYRFLGDLYKVHEEDLLDYISNQFDHLFSEKQYKRNYQN